MADLNYIDRDGEIKIVGQDATGTSVNYVGADANGNMLVKPSSAGPVTPGVVAANSNLIGGQYNTTLPTLTTGQQVALQVDSSGRLLTVLALSNDTNYGVVGANTLRAAAQIGNATGAANFGAGAITAQTLRVALPTDQTASTAQNAATPASGISVLGEFNTTPTTIVSGNSSPLQLDSAANLLVNLKTALPTGANVIGAVTQSGTWTVQPGNTANTTAWFVKDNSLGTVAAGVAGTQSSLAGGVFNTALPTLTTGQQASLQLDSSGRLIIAPLTGTTIVTVAEDHNWGTVGANTLRAAAEIGNAAGAADFAAGNSSAQTLRVVIATNQAVLTVQGDSASGAAKAGNPVQIGGVFNTTQPTVTTGQTVEAQSTARGALIVSTGVDAFNINNISGTISLPTGAATSALQTTGNTSLATIVTNTTNLVVAQGSTTAGQSGPLMQGAINAVPPAYTTGQTAPLSLNGNGNLRVADVVNDVGQYRAQSVTTTAAEALGAATILVDRKSLTITPTNGIVYWGYSNAVTTSTGTPIFKNQCMSFAVGANVHIFVISAGTVDCRITEGS